METFSALLAICAGIHRSPVNSPYKGQWRWALLFSLICAWINGWVNRREVGDLRRHRTHYDVTVMNCSCICLNYTGTLGLCNIGYSSQMHLKLESRKISFVHNTNFSCPIVLKFCTEHDSDTCRALCKISQRLSNCETSYGQIRFHEIWV